LFVFLGIFAVAGAFLGTGGFFNKSNPFCLASSFYIFAIFGCLNPLTAIEN
jgi:hypothetical protein